MILNSLIAFLHFVAAMSVVATLVYEKLTFSQDLSVREARRLQKVDAVYGLSSMMVILLGFLRVYYFEKGSSFYFSSTFFWVKMGMFVIVGLLSIYPTIKMIKWKEWLDKNEAPEMTDQEFLKIKKIMNFELFFLSLVILSASMMAKGIGF
jgi:putative membrane protein